MKNYIIIILSVAFLFSCKKDDGCKTCEETYTITVVPCSGCERETISTSSSMVEVCSEDQLDDVELQEPAQFGAKIELWTVNCHN